jgi:hypothetical protein
MEKEFDITNLTQQDFMEMAAYVAHTEQQNRMLVEQLRETKAYLTATIQQRNAAQIKLQDTLNNMHNVVDITTTEIISSGLDLINPEQWAVPAGKVSVVPKSNKI